MTAFDKVKNHKGGAGVDGVTIENFEKTLETTFTRYGTECHREPTFLHPSLR